MCIDSADAAEIIAVKAQLAAELKIGVTTLILPLCVDGGWAVMVLHKLGSESQLGCVFMLCTFSAQLTSNQTSRIHVLDCRRQPERETAAEAVAVPCPFLSSTVKYAKLQHCMLLTIQSSSSHPQSQTGICCRQSLMKP